MPKSPIFYLLYMPDDLEYFKTLDPNINTIEDVMKTSAANQVLLINNLG